MDSKLLATFGNFPATYLSVTENYNISITVLDNYQSLIFEHTFMARMHNKISIFLKLINVIEASQKICKSQCNIPTTYTP